MSWSVLSDVFLYFVFIGTHLQVCILAAVFVHAVRCVHDATLDRLGQCDATALLRIHDLTHVLADESCAALERFLEREALLGLSVLELARIAVDVAVLNNNNLIGNSNNTDEELLPARPLVAGSLRQH